MLHGGELHEHFEERETSLDLWELAFAGRDLLVRGWDELIGAVCVW